MTVALASDASHGVRAQGRLDAQYVATIAGVPVGHGNWVVEISDREYTAAASGAAGRPIRVQVLPGGSPQAGASRGTNGGSGNGSAPNGAGGNGSARSRAEHDPVVRRMREKFGAEIRTVIDYREKGRN